MIVTLTSVLADSEPHHARETMWQVSEFTEQLSLRFRRDVIFEPERDNVMDHVNKRRWRSVLRHATRDMNVFGTMQHETK